MPPSKGKDPDAYKDGDELPEQQFAQIESTTDLTKLPKQEHNMVKRGNQYVCTTPGHIHTSFIPVTASSEPQPKG